MKNIEIKEMNAEQREAYMLMVIMDWKKYVMEEVISDRCTLQTIGDLVEELRFRIKLLNNVRVMHGKTPLTAYMLSHNLT